MVQIFADAQAGSEQMAVRSRGTTRPDTAASAQPHRLRPSERMDLEAERMIWEANIDLINEQGCALVASSADR